MCLSTHLQIIGHAFRGFVFYWNNSQIPVWIVRCYASPDRNEQGANRLNIHHEAKHFENTPNPKVFAFGRKVFDGD
jgi:hypothetical protein